MVQGFYSLPEFNIISEESLQAEGVAASQIQDIQGVLSEVVATNPAEKNATVVLNRAIEVARAKAESARAKAEEAKAIMENDATKLADAKSYVTQCEQTLAQAQAQLEDDQSKYLEIYGSLPSLQENIEPATLAAANTAYQNVINQSIEGMSSTQVEAVNSFVAALEDPSIPIAERLATALQLIEEAKSEVDVALINFQQAEQELAEAQAAVDGANQTLDGANATIAEQEGVLTESSPEFRVMKGKEEAFVNILNTSTEFDDLRSVPGFDIFTNTILAASFNANSVAEAKAAFSSSGTTTERTLMLALFDRVFAPYFDDAYYAAKKAIVPVLLLALTKRNESLSIKNQTKRQLVGLEQTRDANLTTYNARFSVYKESLALYTAYINIYEAYKLSLILGDISVDIATRIANGAYEVNRARDELEASLQAYNNAEAAYIAAESALTNTRNAIAAAEETIETKEAFLNQSAAFQTIRAKEEAFLNYLNTSSEFADLQADPNFDSYVTSILTISRNSNSTTEVRNTVGSSGGTAMEHALLIALFDRLFVPYFDDGYYAAKGALTPEETQALSDLREAETLKTQLAAQIPALEQAEQVAFTSLNSVTASYNEKLRHFNALKTIFDPANLAYTTEYMRYVSAQEDSTLLNTVTIPEDQQAVSDATTSLAIAQAGIPALEAAAASSAAAYEELNRIAFTKERVLTLLQSLAAQHLSIFASGTAYLPKARRMRNPGIRI